MRFFTFLILILICVTAFAQPQQKNEVIMVDAMKRSFITYLPSAEAKDYKMSLIISLHGGFASPAKPPKT